MSTPAQAESSAQTARPLFAPLKLGPTVLGNRVVMAALTRERATGNVPNALMREYYAQRARGGAGLIITEGALVSQQGTEWANAPGIWSAEQVAEWKKIVSAVHAEGGRIFAQLWHTGRVAHPDAPEQKQAGTPVYAPSAIAAAGVKFRFLPDEPTAPAPTAVEDPSILVAQFKSAAINAKEAGFDGVELHAASGYLVQQFLDLNCNQRTDNYGGSVENRARFGLEVLKALVEVWGPDRVGLKLSPAGGRNDVGMPLEDTVETFGHFITEAQKHPLAYICLVRYNPAYDFTKRGTPHDVFKVFRPFITSARLFLNGQVSPEEGARLVEAGKIDAAVFGSGWIANQDLARRIVRGLPLEQKLDFATLYGAGNGAKGYTDYPAVVYGPVVRRGFGPSALVRAEKGEKPAEKEEETPEEDVAEPAPEKKSGGFLSRFRGVL
ncbi:hypothetical protein PLICRDRAFT_160632 [Plicaturopsis crispa FD-325 SS-3]|nr:hypothetical protein PLICRDRAFT_160632 [Plicaturopsis crispa FD-325 SS-3]